MEKAALSFPLPIKNINYSNSIEDKKDPTSQMEKVNVCASGSYVSENTYASRGKKCEKKILKEREEMLKESVRQEATDEKRK